MNMYQSFILGIIQGFTELLPVSSSAHLVLLPKILGWELQSTSFDIMLHSGTLLALIFYFRKELIDILKNLSKNRYKRLVLNLTITTIPALIFGYLFNDFIETNFKSIPLILIMLIVIGLTFVFIDRINIKDGSNYYQLKFKSAFIIGISQILAFLRGCSRSGILILSGRLQGLNLKQATKYSFFAGIPIILSATVYNILNLSNNELEEVGIPNLFIGFATSFITSLISINILLKFVQDTGLKYFGVYRICLAIVILICLYL